MPRIGFKYNGQDLRASVTDEFLTLPEEEQRRRLEVDLLDKHGLKPRPEGEKGFLHKLGLLERPAQALKVGVKESLIGGSLYKALGQVDPTPQEGVLTGLKRGWLGEDEIRTQDFLPDDMPGWLKGTLGFAGDVLTDPLTYSGGLIGKSIYTAGQGIKAMTPRPVALALQSIKENDKFTDFARAMNVPVGDAKKVKSAATETNRVAKEVELEMAREIPILRKWLEDKARRTGKTTQSIHWAMRNWMDRKKIMVDHEGKPLTSNWYEEDGKIFAGDSKRPDAANVAIQKENDLLKEKVTDVLGKDGVRYVDEWTDKLEEILKKEKGEGIYVMSTLMRHYFPRRQTPKGREVSEAKLAGEEYFPEEFGDLNDPAIYIPREHYRHGRIHGEKSADEINAEKFSIMDGVGPVNEADIPYMNSFFHTDPSLAIGLRWAESATSRQKKRFIDMVTDWRPMNRKPVEDPMPFMNVGKWVRPDPDNAGMFQQRIMGKDGRNNWVPVDKETATYVDVEGIAPKFVEEVEIRRAAELAEITAYALARKSGVAPKDAIKVSREAFEKSWNEAPKISMRFKAPKNVSKQITQQLNLMGASTPGSKELKKFFKFFDAIQDPWKAWTLAVRPAYHTRNAIGNILNAYVITGLGSNIPKAVETFKDAAKLQYYARFEGSNGLKKQTVDRLKEMNKTGQAGFVEGIPDLDDALWFAGDYGGTGFSMKRITEEALNRGITAGHYHKDINRDLISKLEAGAGKGRYPKLQRTLGVEAKPIKWGFAFGGTIEGNARYAVFMNTLRKMKDGEDLDWIAPDGTKVKLSQFDGDHDYWTTDLKEVPPWTTPDGREFDGYYKKVNRRMTKEDAMFDIASNEVKASLFDYSDLSVFERDWMKRLMPFYTWTRKNFPAQLKQLVLNPQRAEKLHIAKEQFEHETGDMDFSDYGAFWGKRVPVFLGKESKGVVKAFTLLNTVPLAELQRMYHPKELISEMISPLPKEIFEQISNYDSFRQKPIVGYEGESKDFLGVALPSRLWKLVQLMVPLTEINRLNPGGVFGERIVDPATGQQTVSKAFGGLGAMRESGPADISEAARWIRFFSGVRVYDINIEKQKYFMNKNLKKDLSALKGKLKWAQAKGENRKAQQILELIDAILLQQSTDPM